MVLNVPGEEFPYHYSASSEVQVFFFMRQRSGGWDIEWVKRAAVVAELIGQIKGLWKVLKYLKSFSGGGQVSIVRRRGFSGRADQVSA